MSSAWEEGWLDFYLGFGLDENLFIPGSLQYGEWEAGWYAAYDGWLSHHVLDSQEVL